MIEAQQKAQLESLQKAKDAQEKKLKEAEASASAAAASQDNDDADDQVKKTDIAAIEVEDDFDLDDI